MHTEVKMNLARWRGQGGLGWILEGSHNFKGVGFPQKKKYKKRRGRYKGGMPPPRQGNLST